MMKTTARPNQASATHHRDLRTGQSIWSARRRPTVPTRPLTRDIHCDVVVIGAGISGALIAETLSEAGLQVVVVDRRSPLDGSTAASTAMLQYEIDTPLSLLSEQIGRDRAERLWRRSRQSVDALRDRTERLGLKVDAATRGSIYLHGNVLDAEGLAREADARRRAGFEIELLKPAAVLDRYGIKGRHAIIGFGNYSADPRQLAAGYLHVAIGHGARVYNPGGIFDLAPSESGAMQVLPLAEIPDRFLDVFFAADPIAALIERVEGDFSDNSIAELFIARFDPLLVHHDGALAERDAEKVFVVCVEIKPLEAEDDISAVFFLENFKNVFKRNLRKRIAVDLDQQVVDLDLARLLGRAPFDQLCNHDPVDAFGEDDADSLELLFKAGAHLERFFGAEERGVGIEALGERFDDPESHQVLDPVGSHRLPGASQEEIILLGAADFFLEKGEYCALSVYGIDAG